MIYQLGLSTVYSPSDPRLFPGSWSYWPEDTERHSSYLFLTLKPSPAQRMTRRVGRRQADTLWQKLAPRHLLLPSGCRPVHTCSQTCLPAGRDLITVALSSHRIRFCQTFQ